MLRNYPFRWIAVAALAAFVAPVSAWGADLKNLSRDHEKERWVKELLAQFGLQNDIRVVRDPALEVPGNDICAYATVRDGQQWIAYGADCIRELKPIHPSAGVPAGDAASWIGTAVMCHEVAHVISLHGPAPGAKGMLILQREAELFAGFALFVLGAPLEAAEAYGRAGAEEPSAEMPGRAERLQAVIEGWRLAEASTRRTVAAQALVAAPPSTPADELTFDGFEMALLGVLATAGLLWAFSRLSAPRPVRPVARVAGYRPARRRAYPRSRTRGEPVYGY